MSPTIVRSPIPGRFPRRDPIAPPGATDTAAQPAVAAAPAPAAATPAATVATPTPPAATPAAPPDDLTRWIEVVNKSLPILAVVGGAIGWFTQNLTLALCLVGLGLVFYSLFTVCAPRIQSRFRSGLLGVIILLACALLRFLLPAFAGATPPVGATPAPTPTAVAVTPGQAPPTAHASPQLGTRTQFVAAVRGSLPDRSASDPLEQDAGKFVAVQAVIQSHHCLVGGGDDLDARRDVVLFAWTIHKLASFEEANAANSLSPELVRFLAHEQCKFRSEI